MYRFWLFRMKSIRLQSWPLHLLLMKLGYLECSPAIINQYLDAGVCEPLDDIITDEIRNDFTDAAFDRSQRWENLWTSVRL